VASATTGPGSSPVVVSSRRADLASRVAG
jgi:hypothetical protein